jgi:hypothetical protein
MIYGIYDMIKSIYDNKTQIIITIIVIGITFYIGLVALPAILDSIAREMALL